MRYGRVALWQSPWRVPTLLAVFLVGWAATFAAARRLGDAIPLVAVVGTLALIGTASVGLLCGARWITLGLLLLGGLAALVVAPDVVGDRVLLAQGVTVQARVVSVGYGKSGNQQDCQAADAGTGRPIPGTMRDCLTEQVGDTVAAVVDPEGGVPPFAGSRYEISDSLGTDRTILVWGLAAQTLGVLLAAMPKGRRAEAPRPSGSLG